ncbi:MAG TPA: glycosyltransferase [Candidatus Bathyarchaeia archaeon]|nr:glycosyltransferase [Candidatus Bathyarchaeia archaeon]
MRIAQVIALYRPEFQGGATLVCQRLAGALAARGHEVAVFSGRTTASEGLGAVRSEAVDGIPTWRVNVGGAFLPWSRENYDNPVASESFREFLDGFRPEVVHAHSIQGLGVGIVRAAAEAGIPTVVTMHDWWWLCPCLFRLSPAGRLCPPIVRHPGRPGGMDPRCAAEQPGFDFATRRVLVERALERVARILTPSGYLRDSLIANGFDAQRIAVVENGIAAVAPPRGSDAVARDGALVPDAAPADADGHPRVRFVFVGGAGNREKGLDVLLDALRRLPRDGWRLDAYAVTAEEAGGALSLCGDRLVCHPPFPPQRLDEVLAGADAVVIPSRMRESFSLVAREALARGLAVVAADSGGPEEVVREGVNGLIVPSGRPGPLAAALRRLIDDRQLLARLRAADPPRFATPAEQAEATEAHYQEIARIHQDAAERATLRAARAPLPLRRVLFLTGCDGAPLRYRVWHLVEQLTLDGVESRVLYHSDATAPALVASVDLVILFRAPYSVVVATVVAEARRRRIPVVFSVDDLVFRSNAGLDAPALELAHEGRPEVAAGFRQSVREYERSCAAADYFLGSTEELVAAASEIGVPAFLVRNALGGALLSRAEAAREERVAALDERATHGDGVVRMGFLSGTDTHDRDLAMIAGPLAATMERFPFVQLVVAGPVTIPGSLGRFGERVEKRSFVPWSELPALLGSLEVNLAPLELASSFNLAKSEVKYLEAAALGVPTVASPTSAFRWAIRDGTNGLLAGDAAVWEESLARVVSDPALRSTLGRAARRDVYRRSSPLVGRGALRAVLTEILRRGRRLRGPAPSPIPMEAGGGASVALEPAAAIYDAHQLEAESGGALGPGREIEQSFACKRDGVWRVDVLVGTYARRNRHRVRFRLLDDAGHVCGERTVPAASMVDRSWVAIELAAKLADSAGRSLRLIAEAPEAQPGNEVLLWTAPSPLGELRIGGAPVPGRALTFRTFGEEAG